VNYQYDAMNRMTYIYPNGSTTAPLVQYQWDLLSRQQLITYGDGTTDSYSQYDAADNLQTLTQTYAGADNNVTFSYGWQKNHQRASTGVSNGTFQYIPTVGTTSYGAANADNGFVSLDNSVTGSASFTYDGNQHMTFDGVNTLTYDVENRLIQAQNAAWGTSTYLYDPLGHRKQKQVANAGYAVTTQFVLAGGQEIADYAYNGAGAGGPLSLTVRGVGGLPVAAITPAVDGATLTAVYYHHDVMGSTVAVTVAGTSGASEAYTYSDFGAPGAGTWATYRYAGYRYDNETGLYYVHARYYNPNLGRFLQTDPAGLQGGTNLYAYVGNDPINLIDPTGLSAQETQNDSGLSLNSTSALSQSGLNGLASTLCLRPNSDSTGPWGREIDYSLVYAQDVGIHSAGSLYTAGGTYDPGGLGLYVSEAQTSPLLNNMPQITSGPDSGLYTSTSLLVNQFEDQISNPHPWTTLQTQQLFIVSPTPGVNPSEYAPVNVCYGGSTYGSLGIYVTGGNTVYVNGMTHYPGVP
jgi:RHS repeat-associated protein